MKAFSCLLLILVLSTGVQSQDLPSKRRQDILSHIFLATEIGSNILDVKRLNAEVTDLGLLALDPYTNNFTFQIGAGLTYFESYFSLTLVATSAFTNIVGPDRLFLSSTLNGIYAGIGVRKNIVRIFKDRLSLVASVDYNTANYFLDLSRATIFDRNVGPLLDSSQAIIANTDSDIVQPALELSYTILKGRNRLEIGFRVGYLYHLKENGWENQHDVKIIGLSPIGNKESYNVALRFVYQHQFTKCAHLKN